MSFMQSRGLIPNRLSKSRFNRRLHRVRDLIVDLFFQLSGLIKELNISSEYSIDSFPIATCNNIRVAYSKLIQGEIYRGSKVYADATYTNCVIEDMLKDAKALNCFHKEHPDYKGNISHSSITL